ncbi:MOSC domain-containing protein [Aeromicrobium senzhongii]|uniref:MOSC domain-containing protein n=1 Tax=Aeromicrobium senzhongii TaxID=2663859 RepID=A0ABX6SXE7_9ACTN|nr:MOSC domain-containing protein [Aeromicrobium senzhongii]QNL95766.1 MOSC domain-containing protein [Aeromicrobium senzhongii]
MEPVSEPRVVAVSRDDRHRFSKVPATLIHLLAGHGVDGDVHAGATMKHRYGPHRGQTLPNLRQVHLLAAELFDEARSAGYELGPGDLGENVLTEGVDLQVLPEGTLVDLGGPVVRLTGLRNPCVQINRFKPGLMKVVLSKADGTPSERPVPLSRASAVRKVGVMAVVEIGGDVAAGQPIAVTLPDGPHMPLAPL